ncbi:hypothetical protein GOV06_00685 [Candidatus Woesearchaeota archaeon]|nr:hypothetical protein [Candidatus Woesearchaeota archaeon]
MISRKKGILMIFAFIFLIFTLLNTSSQEIGCCYATGIDRCYNSTQQECEDPNFWSLEAGPDCNPSIVPKCAFQPGCCINTCEPADYPVECIDYEVGRCEDQPECMTGCCFCIQDPQNPDANLCFPDLTQEECSLQCVDTGAVDLFLDIELDPLECEIECTERTPETATIAGFVSEQDGTGIPGASITTLIQTTTSSAAGAYTLEEFAGTILIRTEKPGYQTNITRVTVEAGEELFFDIFLKRVEGGTIYGTITDSLTGQPISGVLITIIGNFSYTDITDDNGEYEILVLDTGDYSVTSSTSKYFEQTINITLTEQQNTMQQDFSLTLKPFGKIKGFVKDLDGQPIPFAEIIINQNVETITTSIGYYEKLMPTPVGGMIYNIKAAATGYKSSSPVQITLYTNDEIILDDFELRAIQEECAYPVAPSIESLDLGHIKGEKAVEIIWTEPRNCNNIGGYTIFRQQANQVEQIAFIPVLETPYIHPQEYIDENVSWDTSYTYWIIVTYYDVIIRNSTHGDLTQEITTGDALCKGKYMDFQERFTEFCQDYTLRKKCNSQNKVISALSDFTSPADCSTIEGGTHFCAGPDYDGETYCKNIACNPIIQDATPFGLYYTRDGCYEKKNPPYDNYCYFDYSETIIDSCYECSQDMNCQDYRSEDACIEDNCELGTNSRCRWHATEYSDFKKGFCYEDNYNRSDYCYLCSGTSLFGNTNCSQDVCDLLGECHSDGISCQPCETEATCEDYQTQDACTGGQPITFQRCGTTDAALIITSSNDACGLGKCKWDLDTDTCFKDGNDNLLEDCGEEFAATNNCKKDSIAPSTIAPSQYIIANAETEIEFESDSDAHSLKFCIDISNSCCPEETSFFETESDTGKRIAKIKPSTSSTLDPHYFTQGNSQGVYYIRYYTTDLHANQEQLKTTPAFIDLNAPKIDIDDPKIIPNTSITEQGDVLSNMTFNITLSETAKCTDLLTEIGTTNIQQQLLSETGRTWTLSYIVNDAYYEYTVTCTDDLGNTNTTTISPIDVDAWHYARALYPPRGNAIHERDVEFTVKTQDQGTCELHNQTGKVGDFSTANGLTHTITKTLANNVHYPNYRAECTDIEGRTDRAGFFFTIDNLPPKTATILTTGGKSFRYNTSWNVWIEDAAEVSFECFEVLPASFGCNIISYCKADPPETTCTPSTTPPASLTLTETATLCYLSEDKGGNKETRKCSTAHIGEGFGMEIITPKYNVSNIPIYDFELNILRDAVECKYGQIPTFDYNSPDVPIFEKISVNGFRITDFDETAPPAIETYPMHIKCKDRFDFVNDIPAIIYLTYDPSAPVFVKAEAIPSHVVQGDSTILTIKTDDRTVCRYDLEKTAFTEMRRDFPGYDDWDTGTPSFRNEHEKIIPLTREDSDKTHTYNIACQNRAGNISETAQIVFDVDFTERGMITKTIPSGSTNIREIILGLETSKNAVCSYEGTQFETTGQTTHTSVSRTLAEGIYDYGVFCMFVQATDETTISFIVDLTKPVVKQANISSRVCYSDYLQPTFVVEDELSDIEVYNYSLFQVGKTDPIIDWVSTESDNPQIDRDHNGDELNLTIGTKYYFKMTAMDNATNWGGEVRGNDFTIISDNSTECNKDKSPPSISLATNVTYKGVKVTIICSDESGCNGRYYGTSAEDEACNATKSYTGNVYLTETSRFCWKVSDMVDNTAIGSRIITVNDEDSDRVPDEKDECPNTPYGTHVDQKGCPSVQDDDADGVRNLDDLCPGTLLGEEVDLDGCSCSQLDTDSDGLNNCMDACLGTPFGEAVDTEGCSDSQKDSDDDGMDDAWEKRHNLDPFDSSDRDDDLDKDKMTNYEEYLYFKQTGYDISPRNKDTDEDGWDDKSEIDKGYNPVDASSRPRRKILAISFMTIGFLLMLGGSAYTIYVKITTEEKPALPPSARPPVAPAAAYYPSRAQIEADERRRRAFQEMQRRKQEIRKQRVSLEKRRSEIVARRREEKAGKRTKFFEAFKGKKPSMIGKLIKKEKPELPAKIREIPREIKEFEKLARLTEDYKAKKKRLDSLIKITKVPKGKKDEFERLTSLIEKKLKLPKKKSKELTPEKSREIRDVFYRLSELDQKHKKPSIKQARKVFKGLSRSKKPGKRPFKELYKFTRRKK